MMRNLSAAFMLVFATACVNPFELGTDVQLPISELDVPASVPAGGRLTVTLTVVTGGCRDFDRFRSSRQANVLLIEAWGTDTGGAQSCTADIKFEEHDFSADGPFSDPLVVSAVQPDGTSITKSVRVE
jgi:hypothetical protein